MVGRSAKPEEVADLMPSSHLRARGAVTGTEFVIKGGAVPGVSCHSAKKNA